MEKQDLENLSKIPEEKQVELFYSYLNRSLEARDLKYDTIKIFLSMNDKAKYKAIHRPNFFSYVQELYYNDYENTEAKNSFLIEILKKICISNLSIHPGIIASLYNQITEKEILLTKPFLFRGSSDRVKMFTGLRYAALPEDMRTEEQTKTLLANCSCELIHGFLPVFILKKESNKFRPFGNLERLPELGFTYEKATFYLAKFGSLEIPIPLTEQDITKILNKSYPDESKRHEGQTTEERVNSIIQESFQKVIQLEKPDEAFQSILPDLINLDYQPEYFDALATSLLNSEEHFSDLYSELFLSQLAKRVAKENALPAPEVSFELLNPKTEGLYLPENPSKNQPAEIKMNIMHLRQEPFSLVKNIETIFHESRHHQQRMKKNTLSIDNLLYAIDSSFGADYYTNNYRNINEERDARRAETLLTRFFLRKYSPEVHEEYIENNSVLASAKQERKRMRKAYKPDSSGNLVQYFVQITPKEQVRQIREKFPILGYITNPNGEFLSSEEVKRRSEFLQKDKNPIEHKFYKDYYKLLIAPKEKIPTPSIQPNPNNEPNEDKPLEQTITAADLLDAKETPTVTQGRKK